jgi:hypothetical protein
MKKKLADRLTEFAAAMPEEKKKKGYHPVAGAAGALVLPGLAVNAAGLGTLEAIKPGGVKEVFGQRDATRQSLKEMMESMDATVAKEAGKPKRPKSSVMGHDPSMLPHDKEIMGYLKKRAAGQGAQIHETTSPQHPAFAWSHEPANTKIGAAGRVQVEALVGTKAERGIGLHKGIRPSLKPGALAHELGHIEQPRFMRHPIGRAIGPHGSGLASLYTAIGTRDEKKGKIAAAVGTAAMLPTIASEVDASVRGIRALRQGGMRGARTLTPGVGLASYGAVAALPYLTHKTKKAFGGYKPKDHKTVPLEFSRRLERRITQFAREF